MRNQRFQLFSRKFNSVVLGISLLGLLFGTKFIVPSFGQAVGGGISGVVHDQSGAVIPGATVTIQSVETGAVRTLETDADGRYVAPSIAVGHYQLTATKEGFNPE